MSSIQFDDLSYARPSPLHHQQGCSCITCDPEHDRPAIEWRNIEVHRITVWIDGGCRNNGTDSAEAYGSVRIIGNHDNTYRLAFHEASTNNQAEYGALLSALDLLSILLENRFADKQFSIVINTDSALVYNQVHGTWKTKNSELQSLRDSAQAGFRMFEQAPNIEIRLLHVGRETIEFHLGH